MEHRVYIYFAIFITIIIGWGSLTTIEGTIPSNINVSDKVIHCAAYLILTLSWLMVFKNNYKVLNISVFIAVSVFFYGIIIEVLQATVTINRQFEIKDIVANTIGIILGFTVFKVLSQKKLLK